MREKERFELEVHVAGICLRKNEEYEVLIGKRSPNRKLYPDLWECGGGQVRYEENFKEAIKRQLKEELGVIVNVICPVGVYEILTPNLSQKKIPGIRFLCEIDGCINGKKPEVDNKELVEWRWLPISKIDELEFIPKIPEEIRKAVKLYSFYR